MQVTLDSGRRSVSSTSYDKLIQSATQAYRSGDLRKAEKLFTRVSLQPYKNPEVLFILGCLAAARDDHKGAADRFSEAVQLAPERADYFQRLGDSLFKLTRYDDAIISYDHAIRLEPQARHSFLNKATALLSENRFAEALTTYDDLRKFAPIDFDQLMGRGVALVELGRLEEAVLHLAYALKLKPSHPYLTGLLAYISARVCDWTLMDGLLPRLAEGLLEGEPVAKPFVLFSLTDDPVLHYQAARSWASKLNSITPKLGPITASRRKNKIHIAYVSADFHDHATSYLMAQLFELHDRSRFEITAISFGPDKPGPMRNRLLAAFDRFEDVRGRGDVEVAKLCRDLEVDIAVDLKGYLRDSRPRIFAERCAPIQINYLGFPGTMGADFIDYIIADRTLISSDDLKYYTEKVIWMPDSYQVNDKSRLIGEKNVCRANFGLPEAGFVFCSFNNNYKIIASTFDVWMKILHRVPGSVLWLIEDNYAVARNLRNEAVKRGIDPHRLIFAPRVQLPEHLRRHELADLFIDNWPCNAHTTASDALWAGLPLVTRAGRSFASRVAASLLNAVGLPELITYSDEEYEEKVVALASNLGELQRLKEHLHGVRHSCPLFDCERFTENLERAYQQVMDRHALGLPPGNLDLSDVSLASGYGAAISSITPPTE